MTGVSVFARFRRWVREGTLEIEVVEHMVGDRRFVCAVEYRRHLWLKRKVRELVLLEC